MKTEWNKWVCHRDDVVARAGEIVREMSLRDQVGQCTIAVHEVGLEERGIELSEHGGLTGFIVGPPRWKTMADMRVFVAERQAVAKYPLLMTSWDCGGQRDNITDGRKPYPRLYHSTDNAYEREYAVGLEYAAVGINLSWVHPDMVTESHNDAGLHLVEQCSYRLDGDGTATRVLDALRALRDVGMPCCACHWFGYGHGVDGNKVVIKWANYQDDMIPWKALIRAGIDAIMVGQSELVDIESQRGIPSSMSKATLDHLRNVVGFDGMLISDCVNSASRKAGTIRPDTDIAMLNAGIDVLNYATTNTVGEFVDGILRAVERGELSRERVANAAAHVVRFKLENRLAEKAEPDWIDAKMAEYEAKEKT